MISIIIPLYNVELYVEECLRSVMSQTYSNFECILVDDGSKDGTLEVVKRTIRDDERFRLIVLEKNGGQSAARNVGLKASSGDFVFFLDSDDRIFPHTLALLIKEVEKHPDVDLVQGNMETQDGSFECWRLNGDVMPNYSSDANWLKAQILSWRFGMCPVNKLIKRDFLDKNNITFYEGIIHEDVLFNWDIQKNIHSMAFVFENTYWYRTLNDNSTMHLPDKTRTFIGYLTVADKIASDVNSRDELMFIMRLLTLHNKYNWWPIVSDKKLVINKIHEVKRSIRSRGYKYKEIMHALNFLLLPKWLINNKIAKKTYYEYLKYKGIQIGAK